MIGTFSAMLSLGLDDLSLMALEPSRRVSS